MILIDKPYASDFLINSIKENNLEIISTAISREMIPDTSLNWITEKDAIEKFRTHPHHKIYTNSENSISWIEKNLEFTDLPSQIKLFKDKVKFRELIQESYPTFFFKAVHFDELKQLDIHELIFPFIIKPAVGFFSIGVYKVDSHKEWKGILAELELEIERYRGMYPKEVMNTNDFIIEEYIEGEEYAIDCYFDANGNAVLLNILHHVFSSANDVSDRVYSTSQEIIEKYQHNVLEFLQLIGDQAQLKNFPAHIEVRISENGHINPIEVNPLRFGGWCTTGDISWYAYGFNSYQYFQEGKKPNWKEIFKSRKDKKYSIIVLDNNSGFQEKDIVSFDYDLLLQDFKKPMSLRKVDVKKYTVFGFLFIETSAENEFELDQILASNLRKYIQTSIS